MDPAPPYGEPLRDGRSPILVSEPLGHIEAEYARIECEDIRGQTGIVAIREEIRDRRIVEQVLHIELESDLGRRSLQRDRQVRIVPRLQTVVFGVVDPGEAFRLTVIIAAKGEFPIALVDEERVLRTDIERQSGGIGQFVAFEIGIEAPSSIGSIGKRIIFEAIDLVERKTVDFRSKGTEFGIHHTMRRARENLGLMR